VAVAFAISRKVGNAVVRNRIRRRLRALIDGANPQPRAGNYLVRVVEGFGEYAYDDLAHHLDKALGRLEPRH
jgi:ribonuclease P protein component